MERESAFGYLSSSDLRARSDAPYPNRPTGAATTGFSASLFSVQRDVTTPSLAVDAYEDFLVRLYFLADRNQIFRAFHRLLVHFLDHIAFAKTIFSGG